MPSHPKEVVILDFREQDTMALLEYLMELCKQDRINGMVYAVALKRSKKHQILCGATGRMADDQMMAAAMASMLDHKLAHAAVMESSRED